MKIVRRVAIVLSVVSFVICLVLLDAIGASMKMSNSMLVAFVVFGLTYGAGALIVRLTRR